MAAQEQVPSTRAEHLHVHADCHYRPVRHVHRLPVILFPLGASGSRAASEASVIERKKEKRERE